MRILVVEDSLPVANAVRAMLERRKYAVDIATDGDTGLDFLLRDAYDAAILDVGLPKRDGFEIARRARELSITTPILYSRRAKVSKTALPVSIAALTIISSKLFAEEELVARLRALARRAKQPIVDHVDAGPLVIDVAGRSVTYEGRPVDLGATEFRRWNFSLATRGSRPRTDLLERIWDYEFDGSSNIVDVYVSQLRAQAQKSRGR